MGTPRGSKKYNLEISTNPSSFCVGSYNGVLVVQWLAGVELKLLNWSIPSRTKLPRRIPRRNTTTPIIALHCMRSKTHGITAS
jgi:hypothetical protein